MNCEKCNGTGNEGFISVLICSDCGGTGIAEEKISGTGSISEPALKDVEEIRGHGVEDCTFTNNSFESAERIIGEPSIVDKTFGPITKAEPVKTACKLQPLGAGAEIPGKTSSKIVLTPVNAKYFCARQIKMMGYDPGAPSTNMRFLVGGVAVGGVLQMGNACYANGGPNELPSDFFYDFVDVDWAPFSAFGLGRECIVYIFNPNSMAISVKVMVMGEPLIEPI